jgi:hypothetical protein
MVMALAGNKSDLEDKRKVTAEVSVIVLQYAFSAILVIFVLCSQSIEIRTMTHVMHTGP